jgi:hypothetical protein
MNLKKIVTLVLITVLSTSLMGMHAPDTENSMDTKIYTGSKEALPEVVGRVHRAGLLWMLLTNAGYFGSGGDDITDPCTGKNAVSSQLPGGSGNEFLFVGGLVFGGYLNAENITMAGGTVATRFNGPYATTAYEGWMGSLGDSRNMPKEMWPARLSVSESFDGFKELSNVKGKQNCLTEDVYDVNATAEEQFTTWYTDKYVNDAITGECATELRSHVPLGIEVKQQSYAWSYDYAQKFIIIDYTIYNTSENALGNPQNIYNFFMGVYFDCDILHESFDDQIGSQDDMGGFIGKYEYFDTALGRNVIADLNAIWAADNDGRDTDGDVGAGEPLNGPTGVVTIKVLRSPNPGIRYAYNMYVADSDDEAVDWGPMWFPGLHNTNDEVETYDGQKVFGKKWAYDLTVKQLGYDDGKQGYNTETPTGNTENKGGATEGRPAGDRARYMVMSNGEFDFNQYHLPAVYNDDYNFNDEIVNKNRQVGYWKKWDTQDDGELSVLEDLANGRDTKSIISFGPLGTKKTINLAWDSNDDDQVNDLDTHKSVEVYEFSNGDSLKLTLGYIVNTVFHVDVNQDIENMTLENYPDAYTAYEEKLNFTEAVSNILWTEKVYDVPMKDTPLRRPGTNDEKRDGWYGEDIGLDGVFAKEPSDLCWWNNTLYSEKDETEGNYLLDTLETVSAIIEGDFPDAYSEDLVLKYGNGLDAYPGIDAPYVDDEIGSTEEYGFKVKREINEAGDTEWVRYGYGDGILTTGDGVPDFDGPPPPPSPRLSLDYDGSNVTVSWRSHEMSEINGNEVPGGSEFSADPFSKVYDFEGYSLSIANIKRLENFVNIFSADNINYVYKNVNDPTNYWLPDSVPTPLTQEQYDSGNYPMTHHVTVPNQQDVHFELKPFGKNIELKLYDDNGEPEYTGEDLKGLYNKDPYSTADYNFIATRSRDFDSQFSSEGDSVYVWDYKFTFLNKTIAREFFIAVTASDFGDITNDTPPQSSNPLNNAISAVPGKFKNDDKVYVVPNPYRVDVDYEALGWENIGKEHNWSSDDRKIVFFNIPKKSVIRIYTLAGDLVKMIAHNGDANEENKFGTYAASWNLLNENSQTVTSGVYFFHVESLDDDGYDEVGKFVIIK